MSYTERFKVLKIVYEAKIAVKNTRLDAEIELTPAQNSLLERLYVDFEKLENELILGVLEERIAALRRIRRKLMRVTKKINEDIEKLAKIAKMVGRAAAALKLLVDIVSRSNSLGLI